MYLLKEDFYFPGKMVHCFRSVQFLLILFIETLQKNLFFYFKMHSFIHYSLKS